MRRTTTLSRPPIRLDLHHNMDLRFSLILLIIAASFAENCATKGGINEIINNKKLKNRSFLGLVVPNTFELGPLLQSSSFVADPSLPYLDFSEARNPPLSLVKWYPAPLIFPSICQVSTPNEPFNLYVHEKSLAGHSGEQSRRFRFGKVENKNVVMVMTGLGMLNAGIATELLLSLFKVESVLHFGIAGNADPKLHVGDVVIPKYWSHTGLWNWQRFGDGPNDELALESNGDYTRKYGYLKFSDYETQNNTKAKKSTASENLLNNVWYQPEEIFPVDGTPEVRQHAFWVPVDGKYYELAKKLEGMKLEGCVNSTCLHRPPQVVRVARGCSADIFVDNAAYREFLYSKFNVTPLDMESAAVALVCLQHKTPFITIRALSDLAGGGSAESNEADVFAPLAADNAVKVLVKFITLLP
ncbi:uncharacterized protein LOC113338108 isoform X1 [Papaver somniferum]|uniref:uncharacterized protein LOC113338108 isoform X1 n=1 Tax=Papaver somniferum TaxID=3469 RepID=UPI000E6FF81D|nr:uncharacterized protein LOC113338108 isoform X1 [Papaver somniferum]